MAVECFKLLHELIDSMEDRDEIVFADEYYTWMITGDEKQIVQNQVFFTQKIVAYFCFEAGGSRGQAAGWRMTGKSTLLRHSAA